MQFTLSYYSRISDLCNECRHNATTTCALCGYKWQECLACGCVSAARETYTVVAHNATCTPFQKLLAQSFSRLLAEAMKDKVKSHPSKINTTRKGLDDPRVGERHWY